MTSSLPPTRVGVIGVGHLGQHHARLLSELPRSRLVGVFDTNRNRAERIAKKTRSRAFGSLESLLADTSAVVVATPTETHFSVARQALEANRDVLVEKPITPSLDEASRLVQLASEKGRLLQVGHVERFNGAVLAAREWVENPRFVEVHRLSPFPDRSTDIGVILDVMIHDIDILLSLVHSSVESIDAIGTAVLTEKEDIANARLRFASGCVANITASRISYQTMRKIRIFEPDRYISIDYHKQDAVIYRKKDPDKPLSRPEEIERVTPRIRKTEPLRLELEAFLAACRGERPRAATGEEARSALQLALEIGNRIRTDTALRANETR
ncbi:MAG: gfo/Idh/MocA family oxidoreductase [Candidatus Hydrogenedentota bacterium]|nr:MAG: gfo/Idh/MocA family oxidoreductase [Candidatus Hydrogenedentota bacterium]